MTSFTQADSWLMQANWTIVNDTVMGGRSNSRLMMKPDFIRFEGNVSIENNGGFASVRAPLNASANISSVNSGNVISIKAKGDGQLYQLRLRVDRYLDGPAFVVYFKPSETGWQEFHFSPDDFKLMFRGRRLLTNYPLNFSDIQSVGFLISSKQAGPFKLDVSSIQITAG